MFKERFSRKRYYSNFHILTNTNTPSSNLRLDHNNNSNNMSSPPFEKYKKFPTTLSRSKQQKTLHINHNETRKRKACG